MIIDATKINYFDHPSKSVRDAKLRNERVTKTKNNSSKVRVGIIVDATRSLKKK